MSDNSLNLNKTGLVSVTFRNLSPEGIVDLIQKEHLDAIEWGGDVHVPHGDIAQAKKVASLTRDAGLQTAAYGSYYRMGVSEGNGLRFESVLASAVELGAPVIRVWAGKWGSDVIGDADKAHVLHDALRIAEMAAAAGIKIGLEFHGNTLNDTPSAARELFATLNHPNMFSLWQPLPTLSLEEQDESLSVVLPRLCHLHVYHMLPKSPVELLPLVDGIKNWKRWFTQVEEAKGAVTGLLEFVRGNSLEQYSADADALRQIFEK